MIFHSHDVLRINSILKRFFWSLFKRCSHFELGFFEIFFFCSTRELLCISTFFFFLHVIIFYSNFSRFVANSGRAAVDRRTYAKPVIIIFCYCILCIYDGGEKCRNFAQNPHAVYPRGRCVYALYEQLRAI